MKKTITFLLAMLFAVASASSQSSGTCGNQATWDYNDGVLTISGTGTMTNFGSDDNLAPWVDYQSTITDLVISEGITSIGNNAFKNCGNLKSVKFPTTLNTVGSYAFHNCISLTSIDLSGCSGLINIFHYAFWSCQNLTDVKLPASLKVLDEAAFYYCTSLPTIDLSVCTSLAYLGMAAFRLCTCLVSVNFPASMKSFGSGVFYGCTSLTSIDLSGLNDMTDISGSTFINCTSLKTVALPASLTKIYGKTFENCTSLEAIDLSVCTKSKSIGDNTFASCEGMKVLTLPASLTTIGSGAFVDCKGLTEINSLATVPPELVGADMGDSPFYGVPKSLSLNVPPGRRMAYENADGWKEFTNIRDGQSGPVYWSYEEVTKTLYFSGKGAMDDYNESTNIEPWSDFKADILAVVMEEGVTKVGDFAFKQCINVATVSFPTTLEWIGNNAFYNCKKLTSVDMTECT